MAGDTPPLRLASPPLSAPAGLKKIVLPKVFDGPLPGTDLGGTTFPAWRRPRRPRRSYTVAEDPSAGHAMAIALTAKPVN